MSSSKLEEGMRRLCFQYGWSYAVFWRLESDAISGLLKVGRAYYEDNLGKLMSNILHQVHRLGEGVIGGVALSGRRQWIFSDTYLSEHCLMNSPNNPIRPFQGNNGGCDLQFLDGIKTIATVPLQPLGVMQFGSSQKILENLEFISNVQGMIQNTDFLSELLTCGDPHDVFYRNKDFNMDSMYNTGFMNTATPSVVHQQYPPTTSVISADSTLDSNHSNTTPSLLLQKPYPLFADNSLGFNQDFVKKHVCTSSSPPFGLVASTHDPTTSNNEILALMEQQLLNIIETDEAVLVPPASSSRNSADVNENINNNSDVIFSDHELFDGMELDLRNCNQSAETAQGYWEDVLIPNEATTSLLECIPELGVSSMGGSEKDIFSEFGLEQVVNNRLVAGSGNSSSAKSLSSTNTVNSTIVGHNSRNNQYSMTTNIPLNMNQNPLPAAGLASVCGGSSSSRTTMQVPSGNLMHLQSQVSSWIDDCYSMNASTNSGTIHSYKSEEHPKVVPRKRAKPGENARPRPKDRQMIQDRVKELREIIPNGTKCSIDALLDRTIKHMVYLQNVTKYAEKIKQADESKVIGDKGGVVLRDNNGNGGSAGTTWAFEVGGQNMVCPIVVEDLSPPGQMLVKMLCEERGLFLEMADVIRGFDMVILKGMMEVRDSKIWAKFLVEANREVTRMEIFPSLMNLLQQNSQKHRSHSHSSLSN